MALTTKIKKKTLRNIKRIGLAVLIAGALAACTTILITRRSASARKTDSPEAGNVEGPPKSLLKSKLPVVMYGIRCDDYAIDTGRVSKNQTLSHILGNAGMSATMIDRITGAAKPTFNMRKMKVGQPYTFLSTHGLDPQIKYFIYEQNVADYIIVALDGDSVAVTQHSKPMTIHRRKESAEIESSLWNAMAKSDLPVSLSCRLEDIFGWSVDFFGLKKGDKLTIVFDEHYIDDVRVDIGQVWGAMFEHLGKTYYAIPFEQAGKMAYWDEKGKSLKKQFLKAPLKYTRISSQFSNSRLHPILKIRRPHHGVDYAAPIGTRVVAVANGTVTAKKWDGRGGGNMLKIKHGGNLSSGYLHLQKYAAGIHVGSRVSQGQVIGYVGSTGSSTGPHLDFRLWKGATAINPQKAISLPMEPISVANKAAFESVRAKVMTELKSDDSKMETLTEL